MKNRILITGLFILLFLGLGSADNGRDGRNTTTTTTTLLDGTFISIDVATNDTVTLIVDGTNILQNKGDWSDDKAISTLIMMLRNGIGEMNGGGKAAGLTGSENALMYYLITMTDLEIEKFYYQVLAPQLADLGSGVSSNRRLIDENTGRAITNYQIGITNKRNIQNLQMEFEAMRRTFEKEHSETYCESLREVMGDMGIDRVKCGLASKKCYNGDIYDNEGGRDFCVDLDHSDFPGCYVEEGQCGHIAYMDVSENYLTILFSDSTTYQIIKIATTNQEIIRTSNIIDLSDFGVGTHKAKITVKSGPKEIFDEIEFTIEPSVTTTTIPSTTTTTAVNNPGVVSRAFSFDGGGLLVVKLVVIGILGVAGLLLLNGIAGNLRK